LIRGGRASRGFSFRPDPDGDGSFVPDQGAPIPVPAPDWDMALELLRRFNALRDSSGKRLCSILTEDGFEPWWYGQDRLLRFYLIPLTQLLPVWKAAEGSDRIRIMNAPPDFDRVLRAVCGNAGFPVLEDGRPRSKEGALGKTAMLAFSLASLAAFRLARRDTVFYIIDHVSPGLCRDFRFDPLYGELDRRGFRYAEYAHTLSPRQALGNSFRRGRPVFFLESADFWGRISRTRVAVPKVEIPLGKAESIEDRALWALVPLVLQGAADSIARQRILKRALRFQRVARALIFDDNRHNHELIAACLSLGIPVLGFQHGVFNKFHAGLMAYGFAGARPHAFDRYGVWSGLFRDRLLRNSALYGADRVFVAGPVRPPQTTAAPSAAGSGVLRVLVVSEPLARKREAAAYLRPLAKDPGFELCLKLRPGESPSGLQEYGLSENRVRLLQTGTVYDAFAQVDVAVGTYSSVLYEAALAGLPVVWLHTTRAYGRELMEEGLAEAAERPEDLPGVIRRAAALNESDRQKRRERIWGGRIRDGSASLVEALQQMGVAEDQAKAGEDGG
jgi:hypothetical protein